MTKKHSVWATAAAVSAVLAGGAIAMNKDVSDDVIASQRAALAAATDGAGFGPQAPRDIDSAEGSNTRVDESAPADR